MRRTGINPFAPKTGAVQPRPAFLPAPGHPPTPRLQAAGANAEEIAEAERRWAAMTERERWEATDAMNAMTNEDLAEQIAEGRAEAEEPQFDGVAPNGTVAELRAWMGEDPQRARLALEAERERAKPRSGITDYAEELLASG